MAKNNDKQEKKLISDMLADFIQENRKRLIIGIAALIVLLGGGVIGMSVRGALERRAISRVETLNERYEALRFDINESSKAEEVRVLLEELGAFAGGHTGYAGSRASALMGAIHGDQKNWGEAEQAWLAAAKKGAKTYLAPAALYNAAIASEEGGNADAAIGYLRECLAYRDDFPAAARAQFAIGRLLESLQKTDEAIEAYRELIENWPAETVWTNLANSRILTLSGSNS